MSYFHYDFIPATNHCYMQAFTKLKKFHLGCQSELVVHLGMAVLKCQCPEMFLLTQVPSMMMCTKFARTSSIWIFSQFGGVSYGLQQSYINFAYAFMSSKCWREDHSGDFAPTLWTHKGICKVGSLLQTLKSQQILTSWLQIFFKAKCQSCGHPTHTQPWNPSAAISKTCLVCLSVRDMTRTGSEWRLLLISFVLRLAIQRKVLWIPLEWNWLALSNT